MEWTGQRRGKTQGSAAGAESGWWEERHDKYEGKSLSESMPTW